MGFMRAGMSWAGNAANKVMRIKAVMTDKGETDVWMDYFMWQFEMEWLSQCEHAYWYSRYNRQANGEILLKDLATGKVIMQGSGMLEQVQNKSTYSTLTYDFLTQIVGDALFGMSDTANMSITLHTGRGGMRSFDAAIKAAGGTDPAERTGSDRRQIHHRSGLSPWQWVDSLTRCTTSMDSKHQG